jgi:hypothetical protein
MSARSNYTKKEYLETQLAYLAGIMDGEGTFFIGNFSGNRKNGDRHYQTTIKVSCTDKSLIDWLLNTFGGTYAFYEASKVSKKSKRDVHIWACTGDRLLHLCELMIPYLIIKKNQSEIMIRMRKTYTNAHNVKGVQRVQNVPQEILAVRKKLFDQLRSLHIRH